MGLSDPHILLASYPHGLRNRQRLPSGLRDRGFPPGGARWARTALAQSGQSRGQSYTRRGQFRQRRGQSYTRRGQFRQRRGQSYTRRGQFSQRRGQSYTRRGQSDQRSRSVAHASRTVLHVSRTVLPVWRTVAHVSRTILQHQVISARIWWVSHLAGEVKRMRERSVPEDSRFVPSREGNARPPPRRTR